MPTSATPSPISGPTVLYLSDYRPGDCLQDPVPNNSTTPWPDPVLQVSCTQAHVFEVVYANTFWAADAAYPGQPEMAVQTQRQCYNALNAYLGIDPNTDVSGINLSGVNLEYKIVAPVTSADWVAGERNLECIAYEPDQASPDDELVVDQPLRGI